MVTLKRSKFATLVMSGVVLILTFSAGASAASTLERIQANLNHGISFLLDGAAWTPKDANGKKAVPISYQGTTYVPLRAVAEATGAEVGYDNAKQQIVIETTASQAQTPATGVREPFSVSNVSHVQIEYDDSGITRNKEDLRFGETQYEAAFRVTGVNFLEEKFGIKVKKGTKKVGLLLGFKANEEKAGRNATYTVTDSKGQALATGTIKDGTVESNEIVVPNNETQFTVIFESEYIGTNDATGYVIWDESYLEF